MATPFDAVVQNIVKHHYHNHRLEQHSNIVSDGIFQDLLASCPNLKKDIDAKVVCAWKNVQAPGARNRKIDLFIGEPSPDGKPDIEKLRICVENKSVITAHRNQFARFDDLNETMKVVYGARPEAVIAATVIIGIAPQTLNVPDRISPLYRGRKLEFQQNVLPRFGTGDATLWQDFPHAISFNKPSDPVNTLAKLRTLPTRSHNFTHLPGYDFIMFVPMFIDNVNPPFVARTNSLGIDVDANYNLMLETICLAYTVRWHI